MNTAGDLWKKRITELALAYPHHEFIIALDAAVQKKHLSSAEIIVSGHIGTEEVKKAKSLKCFIVPWVGVNNMPFKLFSQRGIILGNAPGNTKIVAERALGLALTLTGRIAEFHEDMKERREWHRSGLPEDDWTSIYGKRIAIIGFGNIGKRIGMLMQPFGVKINAFKRSIPRQPPRGVFITNSLEKALKGAFLVFVSLPLTSETKGIIGEKELGMMAGKYLVNVSRGELIEEEPLYRALKNCMLAGAAVDTWYRYPSIAEMRPEPSGYPFRELPNIIFSPHCSMHTLEGKMLDIRDTLANVKHYIEQGALKYRIDLEREY